MVNVGVIGLGFMGMNHVGVYRDHEGTRLLAVADSDPAKVASGLDAARNHVSRTGNCDVRGYTDIASLLDDPRLDLVSICLPSWMHADCACTALSKGKHVLCEKPMAITVADAKRMVEAARASATELMVAHCMRFWPEYSAARAMVQSGSLGKFLAAHFSRRVAFPTWGGWLQDQEKGGGVILDLAIHDIDYAIHLAGRPLLVSSVGATCPEKGLDYCHATLHFENAVATCEATWAFKGQFPFSMAFTMYCEGGILCFDSSRDQQMALFRPNGTNDIVAVAKDSAYRAEIDYFVTCIQEKRKPVQCLPDESALAVEIATLLCESRRRNGDTLEVPTC